MNEPTGKDISSSAMAYMSQAAKELAAEIEFSSREQFDFWLRDNMANIAERASELQQELLVKLQTEAGEKVKEILGVKVWESVRVSDIRANALREEQDIQSSARRKAQDILT